MHVARSVRFVHRSTVAQIGVIIGFWLAGEAAVRLTGLPLPGGMVGLGALLVLLATRRLGTFSMRRGAEWFLADMLLFFVPAVLAVLDHREFLGLVGLKVVFVILLSTAAVMLVTAFTVDRVYRWRLRHAGTHPDIS
jgi:holin-like protein